MSQPAWTHGVRIAGTGSCLPSRTLTNADFEKLVDTTDEWIFQRTGIRQRQVCNPETEGCFTLSRDALSRALEMAGMTGKDLDLVIVATVSGEMPCPSTACRVAAAIGATPAPAFDLQAACSGFVYALNVAEALIRSGRFRSVGVVGCDIMSSIVDYTDRTVSILFGDAAGSVVLVRDDSPSRGCLYQAMGADGGGWNALYLPKRMQEVPPDDVNNPIRLGYLRMNGKEVFRFAVTKFREVIEDALRNTGLTPETVSQVVCHQSNIRIIDAAREKIGIPPEKVYVNIDRCGNSSSGSVGLCFDELNRAGKIKPNDAVVLVAFGGGLTWASSVWRI